MIILDTVTILILVDGFLQLIKNAVSGNIWEVTILILVDGFLQSVPNGSIWGQKYSHNPYFSRWFSAMC